ncbi:hypothetical protein RB195_024293 [Necator americanus]|uniref:Uncharacterized protein n=1 Tax=Necator americanus TaxID=51031 RepID=A0ABR1EPX2_NECAM
MSRLRDTADYISKAKRRWAGHTMERIDGRWTKRTLEWIRRDAKHLRRRRPTRWGEVFPTRSSAGYGSRTSSTSLTKLENILDDNGEGTKRVEEMPGHLSI